MPETPRERFVNWYWVVAILVLLIGYLAGKGVDEHLRANELTASEVASLKSEVAVLKEQNNKVERRLESIDAKLDRLIEGK